MKKIGFWFSIHEPSFPKPQNMIDLSWNKEERQKVIKYLENGKVSARYRGSSRCRFCGISNGSYDKTDNVFVWPSGLTHYLIEHGVKPDQEFIDHLKKINK